MTVSYNGRTYEFRACDTQHVTADQLQRLADENGHLQHDPHAVWLVIRGVGYGWEV